MNSKLQSRAIRLILESLLRSDIRPKELAQVSRALREDEQFREVLCRVIEDISDTLEIGDDRNPLNKRNRLSPRAEELSKIIKRRRLSRNEILNLAAQLSPSTKHWFGEGLPTMSEILEILDGRAPNLLMELTEKLRGEARHTDEYLKQLLDRK